MSAVWIGLNFLPTLFAYKEPTSEAEKEEKRSLLEVLTAGAPSPHDYLYYYDGETLFAVRDRRFKYRGPAGVIYGTDETPFAPAIPQKEWLFDLDLDPQESYDVSARHPEALSRLREAFELKREAMLTDPRGWDRERNCRPLGAK